MAASNRSDAEDDRSTSASDVGDADRGVERRDPQGNGQVPRDDRQLPEDGEQADRNRKQASRDDDRTPEDDGPLRPGDQSGRPVAGVPEGFPTILSVDDPTRTGLYDRWTPSSVSVKRPTSLSAVAAALDETAAVVVVRHELSDEKRRRIADLLDERGPYCRAVVTTSGRSPVNDEFVDQDGCLHEPVDEEAFRREVGRQINVATYRILLEQYYDCTSLAASLEVKLDADERDDDQRYQRLQRRLSHLKSQIETLQRRLDSETIEVLVRDIVPPSFEREAAEREPRNDSKYRPTQCYSCGRDWNVNPDGSRAGYKRLGSLIWKCTNCGGVHNRSNPTNNQIDRPR